MNFVMKHKINILVNIAASDSIITESEEKIIRLLAHASGISNAEVENALQHPQPVGDLQGYTNEEKFEVLYMMIQLMKADGQVYKSEIKFCENIAGRLGYRTAVVRELSAGIFSDPTLTADREFLFRKSCKFQNKN